MSVLSSNRAGCSCCSSAAETDVANNVATDSSASDSRSGKAQLLLCWPLLRCCMLLAKQLREMAKELERAQESEDVSRVRKF